MNMVSRRCEVVPYAEYRTGHSLTLMVPAASYALTYGRVNYHDA